MKIPTCDIFPPAGGERKASTPHLKEVKVDLICEQVLPTFFHPNVIFSFVLDWSLNITICFTLSQVISAQGLGVLQGECDRQRDDGRTSHIMVRTFGKRHRYGEGNEEETLFYGESKGQEDNNQEFIKWAVIQLIKHDNRGLKNIQYSEEIMLLNKII